MARWTHASKWPLDKAIKSNSEREWARACWAAFFYCHLADWSACHFTGVSVIFRAARAWRGCWLERERWRERHHAALSFSRAPGIYWTRRRAAATEIWRREHNQKRRRISPLAPPAAAAFQVNGTEKIMWNIRPPDRKKVFASPR